MSALYAWPPELKWRDPGVALTFVVPAERCNLNCGFCAIRQRREMDDSALTPADYARFVSDIARAEPTAIVSVQGYEPLLPESWPYTSAILTAARAHSVPASLVTNGILLAERAEALAALGPAGVTVSIDSADPAQHDRLRGRAGALAETIAGIRALAAIGDFASRITVSSVLLPRRRHLLEGMPDLLASLGVRHWAISPLLRIVRDGVGGPVAPSKMVIDDVLALRMQAAAAGVDVVLDDELGALERREEQYDDLLIRRFERPGSLVRLTPSGACSVGAEILSQVCEATPVWRPSHQSPTHFLAQVLGAGARRAALRPAA